MRTLGFAFLALVMTSAAYAQDTSTPSTSTAPGNSPSSSSSSNPTAQIPSQNMPSQNQPTSGAQIASQIRSELESAGFKNIRLLPSSFIVRAEDKNGNPVMMVLNPDSMTAVTQINPSNSGTVGQSPSSGSSDQGTGMSGQGNSSDQQTPNSSDQTDMSRPDTK